MININKIFIIHLETLRDRKCYLDSNISQYGIPYEYICSNEEQDNLIYQSNTYYKYNSNIFKRYLTKGEICVSIQHINTYIKLLNNNIQYSLILEDDAIFKDNFLDNLNKVLYQLPNNFDMCFISECCGLNIADHTSPTPMIYPSLTSRCVSGYIVNNKNIPYLLSTLPFQYPIDWHLNMINRYNQLNFFWSEPCLITQGSESIYKSNLR